MAKQILIVYYSHSGNTKRLAQAIVQQTGGTLWEICPAQPYPTVYTEVVKQAKQELAAGYLPPLKGEMPDMSRFDTILVGTPNWCGTVAPPVSTFLQEQDLSGKTVVVFCTHGGGGMTRIETDVARLCPNSKMGTGIAVRDGMPTDLSDWLEQNHLNEP